MKKIFLLLLSAVILLTGCAAPQDTAKSFRQVSMKEAVEMMEKESDYIILDVRTQGEYNSGHIPNAILLPNESIGSEEISALPDKDQLIFVYCRSGSRSKQAASKLYKLGYTNIVEMGGINAWTGDIVTE
ncbi:MAG: rhodanese-like domain-containing protein [Eubacteriales bacterium]|nr:rhodanese-like domain-containing protein [Eubacteriales bacterium]